MKSHLTDLILEDTFGADDADWAIYRKIVRYNGFALICSS